MPGKGDGAMRNHSLPIFTLAVLLIIAASGFMLYYVP